MTARELEVLRLVVDGMSNDEIAARLHISARTVAAHVAAATRKTGTRSRTQLAVLALGRGSCRCGPRSPKIRKIVNSVAERQSV